MSATSALASAPSQTADEPVETAAAEETAAAFATASGHVAADVVTQDEEQKESAASEKPGQPEDQSTLTPALSQRERGEIIARIRQSAGLPPALRERLATLVESSGDLSGTGQTRVPLEAYLKTLEESLPDFLSDGRAEVARQPHPTGDAFFRGSTEELSDAHAEELAQQQLSHSGLLRGQRVRAAD